MENKNTNKCFEKIIKIKYENQHYYVLTINAIKNSHTFELPFIVNEDDYDKIKNMTWFLTNNYICSTKMINYVKYTIYLHRFLMGIVDFDGKNYIDHINRIPQDNRRQNLRIATQTEQNHNQKKRKRTLILPENCGIAPDDIPTNIEYHSEKENNLNYFEVVIKFNSVRVFRKKSSKSNKILLIEKLNDAKNILQNVKDEHPEWFVNRCVNGDLSDEGKKLRKSYFEILKLANIADPINEK